MKKKIIKIIAVILMAAFIAQDIVLAFPKIHRNTPSQSSLQIPSMFQDIRIDRYASMLEAWLKYMLSAISYSKDFNYRLTLSIGAEGIKVDLNFDRQYPEGKNTILPCALYKSGSSRLYEAVITPDGSIQLRDAAVVGGDRNKFIAAPSTLEKRDREFPEDHFLNPKSRVKFHGTPLYNLDSILGNGLRRPKEGGVISRYSAYNFSANAISLYDPYNLEIKNLKNIPWDGPQQQRRRSCQYLAFDFSGIVIIIAKEIKARIPKLSSAEDAGFYDETFCMEDISPDKIKGLIVSGRMVNNPIKELWRADMMDYYLPNIRKILSNLLSILKIPSDKKETITLLIESQEFEEAAKLIFAAFAEQLKEELKIFDRDVLIKDYLLFLAKKYSLPVYNREGEKIFESGEQIINPIPFDLQSFQGVKGQGIGEENKAGSSSGEKEKIAPSVVGVIPGEVEGTHNFIAQGIVAHNTYTAPPALRRYNLDGGQTPLEYLALLKSKLEEYGISTKNLPDEPEQVTAEQIIELWVGIKDTEKEDIIKQALTTTGLKDMLLSLSRRPSEDEIISELGLALAKKILSYLEDNFINSLSEKLEQHRFSEIYSMILELSSKNALVELIRNDKDLEIFKVFNLDSGNTFIEELLNKLTGISNLVHQLAEAKITLDSTLDEKGKVPQQLLNRALQDIKDILNELSRRITTYQQHSKSAQQSGRPDSVKKNLSGIDFPGRLGDKAGFYDPAYVVSNESYRDIARKLRGLIKKQNIEKGRVYLGVSFEQNLSFIAAVDPEMAIILDNTEVAFPMIMALIRESTDLEDMKKRLSALKNLQEADKLIMKVLPSGPHQIMAKGIWRDKGPQWVGQWLSYWQKEGAWLRSKEDFDIVKRLVQDNKIKTISGDWNGETPKYLAGYLKGIGKEINVLYLSNVVPSDMRQDFLDGVENLPKSDNCVVIHGLGRYVGPVVQPYSTSILKIVHKLQQKEKEFPVIYLASGLYWLGLEAGGGLFSQKRIAEAVEPIGYILKTYKDTHPHWPELIKEILATQIKTAEDKDAQRVYQEALGRLIDLRLLPPEDIAQARGEQQLAAFARKPISSPKGGGSMEGQNAPTLCLTPDSLIYLAGGATKPLIEIREGDMVLSLNEKAQTLEPHSVNALLDMGVKPVYRITTAGGKTLKTTLSHPYLTKNGWRKLKDIKVGDDITIMKEAINYQPATINYGAGEEVAAAKEDLSSAVGILSGVNSINHNASALKIKTDAILSNPESMSGRRKINQWLSKRERIVSRDVEANLFNDAFLQLGGKFSEFSFAGRGKLNFLNHQRLQANPNVCLIFSKGTNPNFLASSIPFLSFNTNLGLMGRWTSMASISQPTGLWNTYSLAETCSSSLASKAQSRSHNEYVSNIKYFGEPFLFTITAALKSEALKPAFISSFGIEANFPSLSILTGSFADSFANDADFIFTAPSDFKYNTLISGLSRLFSISEAEASQVKETPSNSDIFWDKIISIDYLGSLPVYDIEVEGTHNFIAQGIVAHNTYIKEPLQGKAGLPLENKSKKAEKYTIKFLGEFGLSPDSWGGIKKLDPKFFANIEAGKIYFNEDRIGELSSDLIERIAAHEAQHLKTEELRKKGLNLDKLYNIDKFKGLQGRIGKHYEKIEKPEELPHTLQEYQAPDEVLSRLRAYHVFLKQIKEGVKVEIRFREFIQAFKEEDLKFLDEGYLQSLQGVKGQGIGEENKAGSLPGEKEKIAPSAAGKENNIHNSSSIKKRFHIQFLLFMLAQAAAETMIYADTKSHALAFLAQSLAKAGGPADKVDKIVKRALDVAKTITDRDSKSHALDFIAQVLAETGRLDNALDVAETIFDVSSSKSSALASKAKVLAKAGRLGEARNTVKTITDKYYKLVAIDFIAQVSGEPGRLDMASRPYVRDTDISFDSESRAFLVMAQDMEVAGRLDEAIAKEAESEINSTLDDIKSLTRLDQDKLAKPLFTLLHNGFLLDEIKEEKFWQGLVRFIRQSGANITNNSTALEEINKSNAEELFNLLSDYFTGFEISLYLPELFDKFRQSQKQERRDLLGNFKDYYASFVKGREPEKGLLDSELIEEIHFSVIGSTKLTQETYHSTLKRFASQEIPPPNFTTPFTLSTASGKLILSDTTEEEEKFIRERLAFLKDISQRALPEVITELLTTFHHVYLKPDSGALADNIRKLVQKLKKDASVERELSSQKVNWDALKKAILSYLQRQKNLNYSVILKEMSDQLTSRPQGRPTPKQIKTYLDKMISLSLALQPRLKDKLDSISLENPLTPEILFAIADVLSEIKPEAEAQVKALIDEVSGKKRLAEIISKRVKTVEGEGLIELEFIPAKNSLDLFFGFFGEDCAANNPEELFNSAFTPIRIVRAGKIVGSIYTLTLKIKSKKSLVIAGIEPETPLANKLNAERFVEDLLNKLIEVAAQNGYTQLLVSTGEGVSSNRENIKGAMKKLSQNKPTIQQSVQPTFPKQTNYSIRDLTVWKKISASSSLGLSLVPNPIIPLADGSQKPPIELKGDEKALSLNKETPQPTKVTGRRGGVDLDRKLARLVVRLGALQGSEQKNNFSNKLILLSKILRGINLCFGKDSPDLAVQIAKEAIKNHISSITSKIVTNWINECFQKGWTDSAAQIAMEAIKNHIPGITSEIVTGWINECFGQGRPDLAAQIAMEAIKNHIPGITPEIVTRGINECFGQDFGQDRPDLAAQIAVDAIKNHISGVPFEIVTRGISGCFEKGWTDSAAQIAMEAIKNHIPGITSEIVTGWINECFGQGRPDLAAQIAMEAIKNHIPGITSEIVTGWINGCPGKDWPGPAAQIAMETIKNHITDIPPEIVTREINECFQKGWTDSAAQIAMEAIKNHIPGTTSEIVTGWINECFEQGRPDLAAQIAMEAIENHITDISPEIVIRGINECFGQVRTDSAAQIAMEAIENHIPGITSEIVTGWINECFEKGCTDSAAQIARDAIKNHIIVITYETATSWINECFGQGRPDSAAQIARDAIKNHVPGVTFEIVTNWINECFGKNQPDSAVQIAIEAEKVIPVTKGTEKIMTILQEFAGDFGAKADNYFLYLITGYALQNNLLPELPVSIRGSRENAFIIPMIEKIISIEGEGITINEIFRPGGIEGLVKLYHETYDCIFSDILPEGLNLNNPRVGVLLKTITHFDTSKYSRPRGESFAELYRQFAEDYDQGNIKPLPHNLPPARLINVHTRRAQVLSLEARKYYQALMDAVKAALSAIDSARQAKGAGEGNEDAYKDTIQTASGIIDEEIKLLKGRENIVPDKARLFLNKRVDLLKVLKQKLSGAIGREGLPLLAVSKDEFRELAGLKHAPLLIKTMLFIHAFLNSPNWQGHFKNPIAREPDLANMVRFIEFVDSFIKPHLLDEADEDVKRLILDCVNPRVFKDENERLIGRKDSLTRRINIRPIRGWLAEFIGYFSDVCWTRTINIMRDNPDAIALVFEDSDSKELLGGTLLMPNSTGGRKVLIDRGLSPRTEVTSGLDVDDFVEQIADFEEEIAAALGAEMIVVPLRSLEPGLGSNNPDIIQYYERAIGTRPVINLDVPNEFNGHDITSGKCVVLREVSSGENESPVNLLRDIVDTEQLSRNVMECVLSYVFSNKRLVLAFDDNLTGLKRQKVRQIIQAVEAWKEAAANKSDAMRRLLTNNLTILQYSSLDELREKLRPDLDDNERNIIFAFTARIEDDAHSPANMGRAVRAVLIEGEEQFTEEDYYPLVEVVTLALAKELSGWDRYTLLSNLAKLNIDYRKLGISDIDEDNRGIIIFRLLPVMKRYDSNERVDRYARLLQFLRSA